jgi:hypothetical protein
MSPTNDDADSIPQTHPTGERRAELERIRDAVWPPNESAEARKARVARNLAALANMPKWNVDPQFIKQVLEDPDNDYFGG